MSYNISYNTLPTFSTNSIGYNVNKSGQFSVAGDSTNVITVCNFDLSIGVYILTVNIYGLASNVEQQFWYGSLLNSQGTTNFFCYTPHGKYTTNPYYMASVNFTHVLNQTQSTTINVRVQPYNRTNLTSNANYNCSLLRIA